MEKTIDREKNKEGESDKERGKWRESETPTPGCVPLPQTWTLMAGDGLLSASANARARREDVGQRKHSPRRPSEQPQRSPCYSFGVGREVLRAMIISILVVRFVNNYRSCGCVAIEFVKSKYMRKTGLDHSSALNIWASVAPESTKSCACPLRKSCRL